MIDEEQRERFLIMIETPYALGGLLGEPYDPDEGCVKFVTRALGILGIDAGTDLRREGRNWTVVSAAQFGDIAVFHQLPFAKYHVALMLDATHAIQSSTATGGVGRIDIERPEWAWALDKIYRHRSMIGPKDDAQQSDAM